MLQVLLRFQLWDQRKPVLLLCSALGVSKELINSLFLKLGLAYLALSDHRGQPPAAITNAFLHQRIQNLQHKALPKPGGGR